MDERRSQLDAWVRSLPVAEQMGNDWNLEVVSGDASFRRYFRIRNQEQSWIAVDAPPETEDSAAFIAIGKLLSTYCQVPEVQACDLLQGFMLLSDFGDKLFYQALEQGDVDELYHQAIKLLIKIQHCPASSLSPYSKNFLQQEMHLFDEWFWSKLLAFEHASELESVYETIIHSVSEQPQVFVHRDFHSRNLMMLNTDELGVIDFQGALSGPLTYDLVSLLKDCYIVWPRDRVLGWVEFCYRKSIDEGVLSEETSLSHFIRWFDWTGIQRHIKVLGIFSRLCLRDNKPGYLQDIPTTYNYLVEATSLYPEFQKLHDLLDNQVREAMVRHPLIDSNLMSGNS